MTHYEPAEQRRSTVDSSDPAPGLAAGPAPVRVVYNPVSGGTTHELEEIHTLLADFEPEMVITRGEGDARRAAGEWRSGLLIVAGGDGTVNEAVVGLGENGFPGAVTLAVLPMGTGNDLAQTLCVPPDPEKAVEIIRQGKVKTLDAVRIVSELVGEQCFANVAIGGLGMEISQVAEAPELKRRWGRLSYLRAALEAAGDGAAKTIRLTLDGEEHELRAINVTVGNCRYAGGGWPAAPRANPEDGLLDVVVIGDTALPKLASLGPKALAQADYLYDPGVFFARASNLSIEAEPGLGFTADGELIGEAPVEFSVIPQTLEMVVGPRYTARYEVRYDR